MGIRLALAPWWVSWTAMALLTAAIFGPIWLLLQGPDASIGWPVFIAAIGFGVFMATVATIAQWSMRRTMAAAVNGLDRSARALAIAATRRGVIPTDPAVLAAAIRLCTASLGVQAQRNPPGWWATLIPWIGPVIFASIAILNLADGDHRRAVGYAGVAAFVAATSCWSTHARNLTRTHLELLHATSGAATS